MDEFGCTIAHVPSEQNSLADVLSRFGSNDKNEEEQTEKMNRLRRAHDENILLPIDLPAIDKHQKDSKENWEHSTIKEFGNVTLYATEETGQIIVPASLKRKLTE